MKVSLRGSGARRRALLLLLGPAVAALALGTSARPQEDARIAATRATLEEWVETRRILSDERRDWALARETLQGRIEVVQGEIAALRKKLADAQAGLTASDAKRAELQQENDRLAASAEGLRERITTLEGRTKALLRRVPDPIRARVAPLSQRIPDDPASAKLAERFQNVVGILNEVDKFHGDVTVTSEVRALPDGTSAEVRALYLGLAHGYFVSGNGRSAGIGTAGPEGWTWRAADEAAPAIARALAILANEEVAGFVPLPVEVR